MAEVEFDLQTGLKEGNKQHIKCRIREVAARDLIEASEESEKLVMVPSATGMEPQLVTSPTLVGVNTLRRQIVSIGDIKGPIERDVFDKLTVPDLNLIQHKADKLEYAARAVSQRGRSDGESEGAEGSHE